MLRVTTVGIVGHTWSPADANAATMRCSRNMGPWMQYGARLGMRPISVDGLKIRIVTYLAASHHQRNQADATALARPILFGDWAPGTIANQMRVTAR